jgi:hypothetical protein
MEILNKHHLSRPLLDSEIYVGRPSPLGNPYPVQGNREEVIQKYRLWLWEQIQSKSPAYRELKKLADRVKNGEEISLVCWCSPLPCHASVIASAINWMKNNEQY